MPPCCGSSNASFSLRNFFSYSERCKFILKLFPNIRLVGLPDYPSDSDWLMALDDIIKSAGMDPNETTYFGGSEEDIRFFLDKGRDYFLVDRFGPSIGSSSNRQKSIPKLSATEVRDALIHDRSLEGMVDPRIIDDVKNVFKEKWEKFKKI